MVKVEFLISNLSAFSADGYVDLRDVRGGVDKFATLVTKANTRLKMLGGKQDPLRFEICASWISRNEVQKVLNAKVLEYAVKYDSGYHR